MLSETDLLAKAEAFAQAGMPVALATVVETWGSAPRKIGAHLIVSQEGAFWGSVSGGCVEGAVIEAAAEVIATNTPRLLEFGVADETAWRVGLSCGGKIAVYVQKIGTNQPLAAPNLPLATLAALNARNAARLPSVLATNLQTGENHLLPADAPANPTATSATSRLFLAAQAILRSGKSALETLDGESWFFNAHIPPPRLVILGAVHIAQALSQLAALLDWPVTLIDPRTAFASTARFEHADLIAQWPQEALATRPLDAFTAFVALTHDPKIDDPGLAAALSAECFYIGALGSRKTHAKRIERLTKAGCSLPDLARIHAPIGLDIGAENPAEIALAIAAQMVCALRQSPLHTTTIRLVPPASTLEGAP